MFGGFEGSNGRFKILSIHVEVRICSMMMRKSCSCLTCWDWSFLCTHEHQWAFLVRFGRRLWTRISARRIQIREEQSLTQQQPEGELWCAAIDERSTSGSYRFDNGSTGWVKRSAGMDGQSRKLLFR